MENILSILLSGFAAFCVLIAIEKRLRRQRVWRAGGLDSENKIRSPFVDFLAAMSGRIPRRVLDAATKRRGWKIRYLIVEAGLDQSFDEGIYVAAKIFLAAFGALLIPMILPGADPQFAVIGLVAGYFYVDVRLKAMARRRKEEIETSLPNALDWLSLSVEAGLDFAEALSRVSARIKNGPLKSELARLNSSMRMGTIRREAFAEMGGRTNVPALKSFAAALIQADALGAGISHVLRATAERLRDERFFRAEKKGAAAAQKALLPLIFCIMPATFVVVFGPLIARLATGGFNALF